MALFTGGGLYLAVMPPVQKLSCGTVVNAVILVQPFLYTVQHEGKSMQTTDCQISERPQSVASRMEANDWLETRCILAFISTPSG